MRRLIVLALLVGAPVSSPAQRLASDFEMAEMRKQIERSSDFLSQLSARLNLGDLHLARNETAIAREEYGRALTLAENERVKARGNADMTSYATATAYAGLTLAKLGRGDEALRTLEESLRFTSDSAKTWHLYATAMNILDRSAKGISAARNAVALAGSDLDRAIYQHALASALIDSNADTEAEELLRTVVASLGGERFDSIRREIARNESFEIYSTARGEAAAYLSLLNRAQLRLAGLLERRGAKAEALATYRRVLEQRTDDVHALAAMARLGEADEQSRWFRAAFDANPFSLPLIRAYQKHDTSSEVVGSTPGTMMRRALQQSKQGQKRAARATLQTLQKQFPDNETVPLLLRELDEDAQVPDFLASQERLVEPTKGELQQLMAALAAGTLSPDDRAALDTLRFRGVATFATAVAGTIGDIPFRFAQPTTLHGSLPTHTPLRLTYRFLGVTDAGGADAILAEPLAIEVVR